MPFARAQAREQPVHDPVCPDALADELARAGEALDVGFDLVELFVGWGACP